MARTELDWSFHKMQLDDLELLHDLLLEFRSKEKPGNKLKEAIDLVSENVTSLIVIKSSGYDE